MVLEELGQQDQMEIVLGMVLVDVMEMVGVMMEEVVTEEGEEMVEEGKLEALGVLVGLEV